MAQPTVFTPAEASRLVQDEHTTILVGQPPEILKSLLLNNITNFDALLLTDTKEKDGALINNLEFPFYFFVFIAKGLEHGRKLKLVGKKTDISHALRLLRITLMGPTRTELEHWHTETGRKEEWLAVCEALAINDQYGNTIALENFFEVVSFDNGKARVGTLMVDHTGTDRYEITNSDGAVTIQIPQSLRVKPPYTLNMDYVPGGLNKLGVEVLGGASGFSAHEACTGLAICVNGDYLLIDCIPFLDEHLYARGIAKNQISAVFLTHLHDDHCSMFPLMMMPHTVEVISTREIFNMAMDKLSCSLGWERSVIAENFKLIEVFPGEVLNYYGLSIKPHVTVHSIPTIGATLSMKHKDVLREICIVGDNNSLDSVRDLNDEGIVRHSTVQRLNEIFTDPLHLLLADGGAGAIHGNPADALDSQAERIIFVHVEQLPSSFNNTFSLASSGKRYSVFDGDASIYTSQVGHYLSEWLGRPLSNRWMRSLLTQEEIHRYNANDVIVAQNLKSKGYVYLILTGYCQVVHHDGDQSHNIAEIQAGDLFGEMSIVTGKGTRNASVVAATPVALCKFSEDIFSAFLESEGCKDDLLARWAIRPVISALPQFSGLTSVVKEKIGRIATPISLASGESREFDTDHWVLLCKGKLNSDTPGTPVIGAEFGWRPFAAENPYNVTARGDTTLLSFNKNDLEQLLHAVPQLNYVLRKLRVAQEDPDIDWILGVVDVY